VLFVGVPVVAAVAVGVLALADGGDDAPDPVELVGDAPTFASVGELVAASDLVVVATVTDISDGRTVTAPDDPAAGIHTRLVQLSVARTLVGEAPRPLVVEEPAALIDGTPVVVDGLEPPRVGDQALWFLVAGDDVSLPYYAVVNSQGRVVDDIEEVTAAVEGS
jgi:hypothetical protein